MFTSICYLVVRLKRMGAGSFLFCFSSCSSFNKTNYLLNLLTNRTKLVLVL